jgi:hypothetical protein
MTLGYFLITPWYFWVTPLSVFSFFYQTAFRAGTPVLFDHTAFGIYQTSFRAGTPILFDHTGVLFDHTAFCTFCVKPPSEQETRYFWMTLGYFLITPWYFWVTPLSVLSFFIKQPSEQEPRYFLITSWYFLLTPPSVLFDQTAEQETRYF